jgi:hypothetical protein
LGRNIAPTRTKLAATQRTTPSHYFELYISSYRPDKNGVRHLADAGYVAAEVNFAADLGRGCRAQQWVARYVSTCVPVLPPALRVPLRALRHEPCYEGRGRLNHPVTGAAVTLSRNTQHATRNTQHATCNMQRMRATLFIQQLLKVIDCFFQSVGERDFRLPPKLRFGLRNVRLTLFRIIQRTLFVRDLAP